LAASAAGASASSDPLVSLSFEGARLPTVIGALARQSGRNFIIAAEVGQISDVTVRLDNVRFSRALELLSHAYSFCVAHPRADIVMLESCNGVLTPRAVPERISRTSQRAAPAGARPGRLI
jgi:hypothetical protein